jgi:hypothetical protein
MAAPPPPPPLVAAGDVQGDAIARGIMRDPTIAAAVFDFLSYDDAAPLRAACRGFRGAVGEHPWALPLLPVVGLGYEARAPMFCAPVRTAAGLARWRAAFPAGRTLLLSAGTPPLADADLAPAAAWGLAGVHLDRLPLITWPGLAALCGPALRTLVLSDTPGLNGADVAAATDGAPRLRALTLLGVDALSDADLACWGRLHELTLAADLSWPAFTGAGFGALSQVRRLYVRLPASVQWPRGPFREAAHLESLTLVGAVGAPARAGGAAGLLDGAPPSLRRVELRHLSLTWTAGEAPDGGVALLAPLSRATDVILNTTGDVTDTGLSQLRAKCLYLAGCNGVVGAALAPLAGRLTTLTVVGCTAFEGAGLGDLVALETLIVHVCSRFGGAALAGIAAGCPTLRRVIVQWYPPSSGAAAGMFDTAAAEAVLAAGAATGRRRWLFTSYTEAPPVHVWFATAIGGGG